MLPRRLDYIFTRHITAGEGRVIPCKDRAASDHDAILMPVSQHKGGGANRATWGPRSLRPPQQIKQLLDIPIPKGEDMHKVVAAISKAITCPGRGTNKFHESSQLKQLRQTAQQSPPGPAAREAWKAVSRRRKQEHRAWSKQQAQQAAQLDWKSLRSLQTNSSHKGWQLYLQDDPRWEQQLHSHMEGIFAKPPPPRGSHRMDELRRQLRRRCKHTDWVPFTMEELLHTSHGWAKNRSTGPDGISHEAARELLQDARWGERLRYLLNDIFYTAHIPEEIDKGITVLLPKVPAPLGWGETRPITLSSTILKWASQLLLARRGKHVRADATLQWARAGRQGVELLATIRRVTQMARDWGVPTWLVKLDIRKAFDSVWQHSMGELVAARVGGVPSDRCPVPANGGEQPWEANLWLSVLETRALNIAVGDVITTVPQTNGIRQGSPDSPDLFGAIVARDLATAIQAAPAQPPDSKGGPPPPQTGGCFLDDTYLWSQNKQHLQATLEGLEAELHEDGLSIHPTKTAILYSQPTGGGTLRIAGEEVECCPHKTVITTLGSPISFGEQTTMIIAEMGRRSRNAFHKHKAILKTKSSLKSRALAHITLVRNAGLYACETWPAHHRVLKAELRASAKQEEGANPQVPGAPNSYNAIAAATGSREIPLNVKPIPGMTMVEHYLWVTTGQIPPSYVTRELLDPDSPHNTEDQGEATSSQAGTSTQQQHGQPRRRGGATRTRQHNRKHEGGGEARTRNKAEKYRIKRWLKAKGLHHTRWGEDWQTAASEKANPTKGTSNHRYPARDRGEEDWKRLLNPWDYPPPSSAQPTGKAANYHQHWHPDQTPEPRGEAKPQQPQQQPHTDTRDKASNYHPHWQPQDAHPGGVHSSQQPKPNPRGEHSSSNNPPTSAGDTVEPLGVSLPIQAAPAFSGETWLMLEPVTQRQWIATVTQTPPAHLQEGGTVAALVGDQFIFTRTRETWMIQYTVLTPDVFVNPAPPVPPQPATAGEDGTSAQDQATAAASSEPPRATTGPLHHASASSSTAAHQPLPDHPGGGRGLYDGRPLRGKPPRGTTMPTPQPAPWYDTVRDGRNIGRPKPTPQPAPTPEAEQVELMQRARPGTGGAASSHEPPPHNRDNDLLRQLQTIHEAAAAIPGGGVLTSMLDVAAQIVLASPTPAAPTTATSSTPERRSRKRPLGDPNAVAEVILYCRTAANSGGSLTAMDRAEDLFFVIGMVERGALQLLEPLPGDVSLSMLQGATQRLPHAVHMLIGARDQALQGHLQWHRPAFWEEIEQLVTPANSLVERRGDAFCEDGLPEVVHPADTIGLSDFKRIVPSLEGEQLTAAFQLLHALEQWRQSQFGGQIAVHDGTQTEEMGLETAATSTQGGEAEAAEPQAESCAAEETPQTGGTAATGRPGMWLGLRGTTESQANQLLGSLETNLYDLVGEPTLPATATLADADTVELPGGPCPFPEGGIRDLGVLRLAVDFILISMQAKIVSIRDEIETLQAPAT
ncbi:unnamed protein product [Symbiodinium microadriaticum]|nr:unnamed protein product [Symbiodinium microadriaticum]